MNPKTQTQNIMVLSTDIELNLENVAPINIDENEIVITDNYCPVDNLIPRRYR